MLDKLRRSTTTPCASVCVLLIVLCVSHVRTNLQLCNCGWMVNATLLYGHLSKPFLKLPPQQQGQGIESFRRVF